MNYYTNYPECPQCNEPVTPEQYSNANACSQYTCIYCSATFNSCLDVTKVYNLIDHLNLNKTQFQKLQIPWGSNLNYIEQKYVDFVRNGFHGKYLVTWPWSHTGFISIIINEYLYHNPDKTLLVIMNHDYSFPDLKTIYNTMFIIENDSDVLPDKHENIRKIIKKAFKKNIFVPTIESDYKIKMKRQGIINSDCCPEKAQKCKNRIIKMLRDDYNLKYETGKPSRKGENGNKDSIIIEYDYGNDIKITINQHNHNYKQSYNPSWISEILGNLENLKKPVNHRVEFRYNDDPCLVNTIGDIKPNLIIIQNLENFLLCSPHFLDAIPANIDSLMFSVDPSRRYLYTAEFIKRFGIKMHTWDNMYVLEQFKTVINKPHSVLTENVYEITSNMKKYEYEFIEINELNRLEDAVEIIKDSGIRNVSLDNMIHFITDMKKTVLNIEGDYTEPCIFKRKYNDNILTYDILITNLYGTGQGSDVKNIITCVYSDSLAENPLRQKIIEKTKEILNIKDSNIYIILSSYDLKGTENIFKRYFNNDCMNRIYISSYWGIKNINTKNNYIISTMLSVDLPRPESVVKLYFIGDTKFVTRAKLNSKYKLDSRKSYPVIMSDANDNVSKEIKKLLEDFNFPSLDQVKDFDGESKYETSIEVPFHRQYVNFSHSNLIKHIIKNGNLAIRVTDGNNHCLFIPENIHVLINDKNSMKEKYITDLKKFNTKTLCNEELVIDKMNTYTSFRALFIQIMSSSNKAQYIIGEYKIDGFIDLYEHATAWIEIIRKAINRKATAEHLNYDDAESCIVKYLQDLNLSAEDPNYIKKWWKPEETISTDSGEFNLYPVDRPESILDIQKIFSGMATTYPGIIGKYDANVCYNAALYIQRMRRNILANRETHTGNYYNEYKKLIHEIWTNSRRFRIEAATIVRITKDTESMTPLECY